MSTLTLVVAVARNGVIGKDNGLPWRLPEDLKHFKRTTLGKPCIMGRKTWESIGARPLPGRPNIVVTRDTGYQAEGATVAHSLEAALQAAQPAEEIMLIGGAQLFAQAMTDAHRIVLTEVHAEPEGDTHFPPFDEGDWTEVWREDHGADERHTYPYAFRILDRKA